MLSAAGAIAGAVAARAAGGGMVGAALRERVLAATTGAALGATTGAVLGATGAVLGATTGAALRRGALVAVVLSAVLGDFFSTFTATCFPRTLPASCLAVLADLTGLDVLAELDDFTGILPVALLTRPRALAGGAVAVVDRPRLLALAVAFDGAFSLRAPLRRAPAPLDFGSLSASLGPDAGPLPGGLLVTTAVGRS